MRRGANSEHARLRTPHQAVVSVYARGRDYHKVLRQRLQQLADRLAEAIGPFGHRVFTDSAPVLEVELAQRSGIGWRGKHTLVLSREAGSMFFLGEIYVDLPLPLTDATSSHCGSCSACIDVCPTQAIVGAVPARCAALHLLPDHRARRRHSGGIAAPDGQSHLRLRRLPAGVPVEQVRAAFERCPTSSGATRGTRRNCSRCGTGAKRSLRITRKAPRCAASAMRAGGATSRWRWATHGAKPETRRSHRRCRRSRPDGRCTAGASTSTGRCRQRSAQR